MDGSTLSSPCPGPESMLNSLLSGSLVKRFGREDKTARQCTAGAIRKNSYGAADITKMAPAPRYRALLIGQGTRIQTINDNSFIA